MPSTLLLPLQLQTPSSTQDAQDTGTSSPVIPALLSGALSLPLMFNYPSIEWVCVAKRFYFMIFMDSLAPEPDDAVSADLCSPTPTTEIGIALLSHQRRSLFLCQLLSFWLIEEKLVLLKLIFWLQMCEFWVHTLDILQFLVCNAITCRILE